MARSIEVCKRRRRRLGVSLGRVIVVGFLCAVAFPGQALAEPGDGSDCRAAKAANPDKWAASANVVTQCSPEGAVLFERYTKHGFGVDVMDDSTFQSTALGDDVAAVADPITGRISLKESALDDPAYAQTLVAHQFSMVANSDLVRPFAEAYHRALDAYEAELRERAKRSNPQRFRDWVRGRGEQWRNSDADLKAAIVNARELYRQVEIETQITAIMDARRIARDLGLPCKPGFTDPATGRYYQSFTQPGTGTDTSCDELSSDPARYRDELRARMSEDRGYRELFSPDWRAYETPSGKFDLGGGAPNYPKDGDPHGRDDQGSAGSTGPGPSDLATAAALAAFAVAAFAIGRRLTRDGATSHHRAAVVGDAALAQLLAQSASIGGQVNRNVIRCGVRTRWRLGQYPSDQCPRARNPSRSLRRLRRPGLTRKRWPTPPG